MKWYYYVIIIAIVVAVYFFIVKSKSNKMENEQLSKNFTLSEFLKSDTANKYFIDNTPDPESLSNIRDLAVLILQPLRDFFAKPIKITSGYRSKRLNEAIGGAKDSQHMRGEAVDIQISGMTPAQIVAQINSGIKSGVLPDMPIDQIIEERVGNGAWVHISFKSKAPRKEWLTFDGKTYEPVGIIGRV